NQESFRSRRPPIPRTGSGDGNPSPPQGNLRGNRLWRDWLGNDCRGGRLRNNGSWPGHAGNGRPESETAKESRFRIGRNPCGTPHRNRDAARETWYQREVRYDLHTGGVAGSIPASPTKLINDLAPSCPIPNRHKQAERSANMERKSVRNMGGRRN